MARQLAFDLGHEPALGRDDYLVSPANALALAMLDQPQAWPQGRMLLIGPEGAGKTHLAAIWTGDHDAACLPARALDIAAADALAVPEGAVVIEDADGVAGLAGPEQALFHLWNLSAARGCRLLLTARDPVRDWGLSLPDLTSRMAATPAVRIEAPDEALLAAVLVKLLSDRQLSAPPGLIDWLTLRMDRDLGLARRLVAALDAEMMADRRPLTRGLAGDLLERLSGE